MRPNRRQLLKVLGQRCHVLDCAPALRTAGKRDFNILVDVIGNLAVSSRMSGFSTGPFLLTRCDFFPLATTWWSCLPCGFPLRFLQPFVELLIVSRQLIPTFQRFAKLLPQLPIFRSQLCDRHRCLKFIVGHTKPYAC